MTSWFSSRTPREQVLIALVIPVAIAALAYQFVWQPLQANRAMYVDQISQARLVSGTAALAAAADAPTGAQGQSVQRDTTPAPPLVPLANRITQAASAATIPVRRIEADGTAQRVTLGDVQYGSLIVWLADLEQTHRIGVKTIQLDRRTSPGTVSARLVLMDLP